MTGIIVLSSYYFEETFSTNLRCSERRGEWEREILRVQEISNSNSSDFTSYDYIANESVFNCISCSTRRSPIRCI